MNVLYDFRKDSNRIRALQDATLNTEYGLKATHGLVGSSEWWQAIDQGELALERFVGEVVQETNGPMGDWPSLIIRDCHGRTKTTTLHISPPSGLVGKKLILEYVEQQAKRPPFDGYKNELIIRLLIDD